MLTSKDIMSKRINYLGPDMLADDAGKFLIDNKIASAPVVDDTGPKLKLLGFLSEADLLSYCANQAYFDQPDVKVSSLMRLHPYCVGENVELFELAKIFMDSKYRILPVLDETGALVGLVRRGEVLEKFLTMIKEEDEHIKERVMGRDIHQIVNHRFIVG